MPEAVIAQPLSSLRLGQVAVLHHFDLPEDMAERLMQMGMIPGVEILAAHIAPAGDPTVYRVDGTEIALRRETSQHISIVPSSPAK